MFKILIMLVMVAGAGALGYFGERFVRMTEAPAPENSADDTRGKLLYKMPLGGFTIQLPQGAQTLNLMFDIDVYVMGETAFQDINGAVGRARLRDATVMAIADLAETDISFYDAITSEGGKVALSEKIVRKIYINFPSVRTARINKLVSDVNTGG
ncbi:MAG: flagellar biosynthesis protein FlgH [Sulfitobacter sp.]